MYFAKDCIVAMKAVLTEMHTTYHTLKEDVSKLDREISFLYHEIERTPLENGGLELYEKLQESLQKRRDAKTEWQNMYNLINNLGTAGMRKALFQMERSIQSQNQRMEVWRGGETWNQEYSDEVATEPISIADSVVEAVTHALRRPQRTAS